MAERPRLLLVDDDTQLLAVLTERLRQDDFEVSAARSGREALGLLDRAWPDLVILDLRMPGMDGAELAARIKRRADIPIMVLSVIADTATKVDLIQRYAEDYLTKPFEYTELRARIQRILRRLHDQIPRQEIRVGPRLTLVLQLREAIVNGERVRLSPTETRVLATLAANPGRAVTTERLLSRVWSDADDADPPFVWVTMRRLRRKIEPDPDHPTYLLTERGVGYRLAMAE